MPPLVLLLEPLVRCGPRSGRFGLPTRALAWNPSCAAGVEAEAELLAAIVTFFRRLGLTAEDVGLKVSSRKVLQAVLARFGVGDEAFGPVCVVVDKMEKIPREKVWWWRGGGGVCARVGCASRRPCLPYPSAVLPLHLSCGLMGSCFEARRIAAVCGDMHTLTSQ